MSVKVPGETPGSVHVKELEVADPFNLNTSDVWKQFQSNDGDECRAVISEEHSYIRIPLVQMGEHSVYCQHDGMVDGSVFLVRQIEEGPTCQGWKSRHVLRVVWCRMVVLKT